MSLAIPIAEEYPFKRFVLYSVYLHLGLSALLFVGAWVQHTGERWGGPGSGAGDSSVKVNLVANTGLPLPQPTNVTDSAVVDPTKSLHKEEPLPPPPEIKNDATEIPKFTKEKPLPPSRKSKVFERKTPDADNAVPGRGGSPNLPTGYSTSPGPLNGGGMVARGEGGGDFAGRYPWYVQAVVRAISQNWMQNTIDPSVRAARRARTTMTFTINRDGSIKNIRLADSSGNRSMDDSAQRALLSIDHFPPLPVDYSGRYVDVTFDFDLSMSR
jgi:TonB family protein